MGAPDSYSNVPKCGNVVSEPATVDYQQARLRRWDNMTFRYLFGEADTYIQAALLLASLIFAILGTFSSDAAKGKKKMGISLILVIVFLMFMWFEIFAYGIG